MAGGAVVAMVGSSSSDRTVVLVRRLGLFFSTTIVFPKQFYLLWLKFF
jgi:hypothetical protein